MSNFAGVVEGASGHEHGGELTRRTIAVQLLVLVGAVGAVSTALAWKMVAPWIVPDEIVYSELAKSIAGGQLPSVRDHVTFAYGVVYPLLISPGWIVFDSVENAYRFALATNAVLIALAAPPSYFIARRVVSPRSAVVVASFSVFVPAMAYSSTLMTENALYPIFLFGLLAILRSLENATTGRELAALAAIGVVALTKPIGAVLLPIYLTAIAGMSIRKGWGGLARYRLTWIASLALAVLAIAALALSDHGAERYVGGEGSILNEIDFAGLPSAAFLQVAAIVLSSAILPFAATCLVVWRVARGVVVDSAVVRYVVVTFAAVTWLLVAVVLSSGALTATSVGEGGTRMHERYLFVVVPLLLTGLALCLERGFIRRSRAGVTVALAIVICLALLPVSDLDVNANPQDPSLLFWVSIPRGQAALAGFAAVLMLAFVVLADRRRRLLWGAVGLLFGIGFVLMWSGSVVSGSEARAVGVGDEPTWIDLRVGKGVDVVVLWNEPGDVGSIAPYRPSQRVVLANEFFNRSVGRVYALGATSPMGLGESQAAVQNDGRVVDDDDAPVLAEYVLTCGVVLNAPVAAKDRDTGAILYRTGGVVRVSSMRPSTCQGSVET